MTISGEFMSPIKKSTAIILVAIVSSVSIISVYYYYVSVVWRTENRLTVGYLYNFFHMVGLSMKDRGVLGDYLPGWTIDYKRFSSGTALRDSMIAGTVDIGFVGCGPFLSGLEQGAEWKVAMATAHWTAAHVCTLVTSNDEVESLGDLDGLRVNMLSPCSMLHISMAMACDLFPEADLGMEDMEETWTKAGDALALIQTGDIDAGWFTIPYNYMATKAGCRVLLDTADIGDRLGSDISMTLVVVMRKFHDEHFDAYEKFLQAYNETMHWVKSHPNETAEIAKRGEYFQVTENIIDTAIQDVVKALDPVPHNVIVVVNQWMYDNGYISKVFKREEVFYCEAIVMGAT